jgi:FolB domain-containing protein
MSDRILVRDLLCRGIVGINPEERVKTQDVLVNLVLHADVRAAAASDDIADAVNYRTIAKRVIDLVERSEFFLVERLAEEIAILCLADDRVTRAEVTVEKPTALRFAKSVGVAIVRDRADA